MILVSVMYPGDEGATFNHDYYLTKHLALVKQRWQSMGLKEVRLFRGTGAPGGAGGRSTRCLPC